MRKLLLFTMALSVMCITYSTFAANKNKEIEKYTAAANQFVKDYNSGNFVAIWKRFDKENQKQQKCKDFENFLEKDIKLRVGKIIGMDKTPTITPNFYAFTIHFKSIDLYLMFSLNDKGKYTTLFFREQIPIVYPKITDKTTFDELTKVYTSLKATAGLAFGIINNGKESTHFYGVVNKNTDIKPNTNTEFEIGSITKTFTAIALLEMQEQGLLNVNDTINKFLPKNIKTPTYDGKEITLESLVTQTSGLPRTPTNFTETVKDPHDPTANYTVKDLYNFLNSYKLTRAVGSKYVYSNVGFGLLGQILALTSETSYEDVIKKEITDKLGMHDTCIELSPEQKKRFAQGYSSKGKPAENWNFLAALVGCGALRSTVNDMLKYLKANVTKSDSLLGKAIQESHIIKFHRAHTDSEQASGWIIFKVAGHNVIWHNGETGGYRSFLGFFEGTKTGVVILSNTAVSVDGLAFAILKKLALDLPKKMRKKNG